MRRFSTNRFLPMLVGVLTVFSFAVCFAQQRSTTPFRVGALVEVSEFLVSPTKEDRKSEILELIEKSDWNGVITRTTCTLDDSTESPEAHRRAYLHRACARLRQGEKKTGLDDLKKAVSHDLAIRADWIEAADVLLRVLENDDEIFEKMDILDDCIAFCTKGLNEHLRVIPWENIAQARLRQLRAIFYLKDGKTFLAIIDLRLAHELAPNERGYVPDSWENPSEMLTLSAMLLADPSDVDRKITMTTEIIDDPKMSPELRATAYIARSVGKMQQQIKGEASADLEASVKLKPVTEAYLHSSRGTLFQGLDEHEKAVIEYDLALKQRPDAKDYCSRAASLYRLGRNDQALDDLDRSIALDPSATAFDWRAKLRYLKRDITGAFADFSESLNLQPAAEVYTSRGNLHAETGNRDAAIADYTASLALEPNNVEVLLNRSSLLVSKKDADGTAADCEKVIKINPNIAAAWFGLGYARALKDDPVGAVENLTKGLALEPNSAQVLVNRGRIYAEGFDFKSAKADFVRAAELDVRFKDMPEKCDLADRSFNDMTYPPEKAIEYITEQIVECPTNPYLLFFRAKRYLQTKEWEKSWEDVNEAARLAPDNMQMKWGRIDFASVCFGFDPILCRKFIDNVIADTTTMLAAVDPPVEKLQIILYRGNFYWFAEEYAKAHDDFDAVLKEMGDNAPMTRLRRAHVQLRLAAKEIDEEKRKERLGKALKDAETVIRADEQCGAAFFCRAKVFEAMGQTDKADKDRRQVETLEFHGDENSLFVQEYQPKASTEE